MKTLKVLSALLCYPQPEMQAALAEMAVALKQENRLPESECRALQALMNQMLSTDLMALQESYIGLFDRGRALSLHLFEHIHGQSRDRGQAMVDLLETYRRHGLELSARELPDYIPLFLEYLAQQPANEALSLLADAMPVMALIGARLAERRSDYHVVFDALAALVGEPASIAEIRRQAATEGPDQTVVNMDQIWEEEAVTFLANQRGCGINHPMPDTAQPVQWIPSPGSMLESARSQANL
ncbi:MAG: nitrate reductase molybdenum cofactor assembly chaperone [Candidatus Contendobacter sp.]|nr:nitrate reductase molybdenum cofactor assembly chaperone [Candidatus Contendobacter sp.]